MILSEKTDTYHDVELYYHSHADRWHFLKNSSDFLWGSDRDGYNHLYRYARDGKLVAQLTKGEYDVSEIAGIDEKNNKIYFLSTEKSPLERHLYVMGLDGKKKKRLSKEPGMHEIAFSSAYTYYVDTYSSIDQPTQTVLRNAKGKVLKRLVDNKGLADRVSKLNIQKPEFYTFKNEKGVDAQWLDDQATRL